MALKPCRECKSAVSTSAAKCPHCGITSPTTTVREISFISIALCVLVAALFYSCSESDSEKEAKKAAQVTKDADCAKDLQCAGDKGGLSAGLLCKKQIEGQAKNSVKWTDEALEPKFSHFRWKDQSAGIITHIGDKVQFQNGFGAYVNIIYECDLQGQTVIAVRTREGRISK